MNGHRERPEPKRGRIRAAIAKAGADPHSRFSIGITEEGRVYYEIVVVPRQQSILIWDDELPGPPH